LYNRRIHHVHPVLFRGPPYSLLRSLSLLRVFRPDAELYSGNTYTYWLHFDKRSSVPRSDFGLGNAPSATRSICPGITQRAPTTSSLQIRATSAATQCERNPFRVCICVAHVSFLVSTSRKHHGYLTT
jgi:hypothetical protein